MELRDKTNLSKIESIKDFILDGKILRHRDENSVTHSYFSSFIFSNILDGNNLRVNIIRKIVKRDKNAWSKCFFLSVMTSFVFYSL